MRLQLLAGLLLTTAVPMLHAEPIRELVIFGDSHSDIGNGCTLFVPADTDCVGLRYSNGPVWVEELAWRLKVPQPTASTLGALNFAFGGARTGRGTDTFTGYQPPVPRVGTQVSRYLQQQAPRGDQLFVVLAGHNDWNWNPSADPVNSLEFTEVDPGYSWDGRELYFVRTSLDVANDNAFLGQAEICLAARIPEPSALGLCGLAAALYGRRRRRSLGRQ